MIPDLDPEQVEFDRQAQTELDKPEINNLMFLIAIIAFGAFMYFGIAIAR